MVVTDRVTVGVRTLKDYEAFLPPQLLGQVARLGGTLAGRRIVQVNATPNGGGVAEILRSCVPLVEDVGLRSDWHVPRVNGPFFTITKAIHNYLQGKAGRLSQDELDHYLGCNQEAATGLEPALADADLLIVHDPQFLPVRAFLKNPCPSVWVCHVDATTANEDLRDLLLPYVRMYDRVVFSLDSYVFPGLERGKTCVIPPAIDPLSSKNTLFPRPQAKEILAGLGFDPERPLMTQVSRFDIWKDPWGVVDAYRMAKEAVPGLQLALVGVFDAQDDPEAVEMFHSVERYADGDPDIHLFTDPHRVKAVEVNAFQRGSEVVVQKSTREGFGLTVTEAMWKGTPVVGGNCGGIRLQIRHGKNGFLVDDAASCAERVVGLLRDPSLAQRIGEAGRVSVARHYLMPRLLRDYLRVAEGLLR